MSQDDGSFNISGTGIGTFTLYITAIGMAVKNVPNITITADKPVKQLGNVKVSSGTTKLKEVSIVGEKAVMEMKVDKKVFNVEKNTTTAGGSATDVLQNVPSVSVDADGNVSLRGKQDVTILIDGKPSTMLGTDQASALQSLSAASIESVEVITNPSAKYDAQGSTGIINIITKKDQRFGINGSATLGAGTRDKYNGNFSLNARKGKWNAFLNSSFRINNTYNNVITDKTNKTGDSLSGIVNSYHTYEHVPRHFNGSFNTIGATYDVDKYNSITVTENINIMGFAFQDYSDYYMYNNNTESGQSIFHQNRYSDASGGPFSLSSSIDYRHKFKKKDEELSFDATYAATSIHRSQYYYTESDSSDFINKFSPITEHAPGSGTNNSLNVWADYTDPLFTANGKLGLGFKSQLFWFNSHNNPLIDSNNRPEAVDSTLLTIYNYEQQIHAGYVNWSDQLGKFSYQLGLRAEDAVYTGSNTTTVKTDLNNSFFNFFPSAFVSYQLPNQQSIYLNYSRRTNRPNFFQLMPFKDVSNPSTVSMGNPSLIPEFINNIEFSYNKQTSKGDNIILSVYYQYTENLIERITRYITVNDSGLTAYAGRLLSQPLNIASGTTYGVDATGHVQLLPIWDATLNFNFFQNKISAGNVDPAYQAYITDNSGFSWFGKINTSIKIPGGFSLQINANYESPKVIAGGSLKETYWVDMALKKNLWKNKATVIINCSDIFKTHQFVTIYDNPSYHETIDRVRETRIGNLTFTYRFGKSDIGSGKGKGKPKDNGNNLQKDKEDRENNLKGDDKDDQGGGGQGGNGGGNKGGGTHN